MRNLKIAIQQFIRAQVNPSPSIVGGTASLACTQNQALQITLHLGLMVHVPWFAAVLGHGPALTSPLGSLWHPRPRVASGLCDQIHFPTILWA
jgi:hypothetical protein